MDLSKFKTPDWLVVGGAVLFLIGGFLDWITVEVAGFSATGGNVFDYFFTGIVPWLLIIATAVLTVLLLTGTMKAGTVPWPMIFVVATGGGGAARPDPLHRPRDGRGRARRDRRRPWHRTVAVPDRGHPRRGRRGDELQRQRRLAQPLHRPGQAEGRLRRRRCGARPGPAPASARWRGARRRPRRPVPATRLRRRHRCPESGYTAFTSSAISSPASVGFWPTLTPAAASASILPWAVPLPPETMAPAWPIFLPAGAVTPAM